MKKIRSYTSIWSVEKVLYSINDFKLPFPITFTQMAWFVVSVFAVMLLGNLPPLSFIDGAFLKYFGVPFALTWFMCQKTFDGKKPYGFLKSVLAYLVRPKLTYAGKPVKLEKEYPAQPITAVTATFSKNSFLLIRFILLHTYRDSLLLCNNFLWSWLNCRVLSEDTPGYFLPCWYSSQGSQRHIQYAHVPPS